MRWPRRSPPAPRAPTSSAWRFLPPWDRASRLSPEACSAEVGRAATIDSRAGRGNLFRPLSLTLGNQSMPEKVLIYSRFPKAMMVRIGERFELMDAGGRPPGEVFTAEQLSGTRAMITAGGTPLGGETMDKMPKLGAIVCYGTGYDGVDLAAAAKRKITVGHSPGANPSSVADSAVTLRLA